MPDLQYRRICRPGRISAAGRGTEYLRLRSGCSIRLRIGVLLCLLVWGGEAFPRLPVRPAVQAGRFYEADSSLLRRSVQDLLRSADAAVDDSVAALIVPHAGHRYAGRVMAAAFRTVPSGRRFKRIFLLGPSHHVNLEGASVASGYAAYATPLGQVPVDTAVCRVLLASGDVFSFRPEAHEQEHCLEVLLPFLQVHLDSLPPVVPVLFNTSNLKQIAAVAEALVPWFCPDNLFVVSSDFSHYLSYEPACRIDAATGAAVASGSLSRFLTTLLENDRQGLAGLRTSACGQASIAVLLSLLDASNDVNHLMYMNTGDADAAHRAQVVGYHAFSVSRHRGFYLREADKQALRDMARRSIEAGFRQGVYFPDSVRPMLAEPCGAFVTLRRQGELRGCVGYTAADRPLFEVVCRMARMAAFQDARFEPLRRSEWKRTELEISVLTPPRRIADTSEFIPGRHGLLMVHGDRRGVYLPQVADETGWSREELLDHCAADKAGIGREGWRRAELYVFETLVF